MSGRHVARQWSAPYLRLHRRNGASALPYYLRVRVGKHNGLWEQTLAAEVRQSLARPGSYELSHVTLVT